VTDWLRRAGTGRLADGAVLVWSVAAGQRGRRWRAQRLEDGAVAASVLLEIDRGGRPSRLEVDAADGLLTLHPEDDRRSAHGNLVSAAGVRPLAFEWTEAGAFLVADLPIGEVATVGRLARELGVGERASVPVLVVDRHLGVSVGVRAFVRLSNGGWRCDDEPCLVEPDGTPHLDDGRSWPLEAE
jgi:hypothetical protein